MAPDDAIRAYCTAFDNRDVDAIAALFAVNGLFEMPFLKPGRLVGGAEIRAGLSRAFQVVASGQSTIRRIKSTGHQAIAEGAFRADVPRDGATITVPFAMVAERGDGGLARLTVYCDARPYRLWSDGPVMALAGGAP